MQNDAKSNILNLRLSVLFFLYQRIVLGFPFYALHSIPDLHDFLCFHSFGLLISLTRMHKAPSTQPRLLCPASSNSIEVTIKRSRKITNFCSLKIGSRGCSSQVIYAIFSEQEGLDNTRKTRKDFRSFLLHCLSSMNEVGLVMLKTT